MDPVPFTHYPLDRADALRKDAAAASALWQRTDASVLLLWRGKPLVRDEGDRCAPVRLAPTELPLEPWIRLFLGLDADGVPQLAACLDPAADPPPELSAHGSFQDLRPAAGQMAIPDAALVGTARGVFAWHRSHGFCSRCGVATRAADAGFKRVCPACGREHFPRVDPVVILLIEHDGRLLLGRAPSWPAGFFSCLAGFVEPGETLQDAAEREVMEEAGVRLGPVRFVTSQPWPFPASLMLGLHARADGPDAEADGVELAEVRWFDRDAIGQLLSGALSDAFPPPPVALAHHLIRWWHGGAPTP